MSAGFGDDAPVEPMTSRGRDWPCLRQFGLFMENKVGALQSMLRCVERSDLHIIGLSIVDSADCSIARLVTDNYERTRELLEFLDSRSLKRTSSESCCRRPISRILAFAAV